MFNPSSIPLHWAHRLSFLSRRQLSEIFRAAGYAVSAEEWAVLIYLWQQEERGSENAAQTGPADIADHTIRDRTTVTRLLDGMEKKGWVTRVLHPQDRRRFQVGLTDAGRGLQHQLVPLAQTHMAKAFSGLDPHEIELANKILRHMVENLMSPEKGAF